ncbi:hypothetical protein ACMD2_21455, partial [Ananas comosus]
RPVSTPPVARAAWIRVAVDYPTTTSAPPPLRAPRHLRSTNFDPLLGLYIESAASPPHFCGSATSSSSSSSPSIGLGFRASCEGGAIRDRALPTRICEVSRAMSSGTRREVCV